MPVIRGADCQRTDYHECVSDDRVHDRRKERLYARELHCIAGRARRRRPPQGHGRGLKCGTVPGRNEHRDGRRGEIDSEPERPRRIDAGIDGNEPQAEDCAGPNGDSRRDLCYAIDGNRVHCYVGRGLKATRDAPRTKLEPRKTILSVCDLFAAFG